MLMMRIKMRRLICILASFVEGHS